MTTETRQRWHKIGCHLLLVPFLVFALFPFYHMAMTSLKTDRELYDRRKAGGGERIERRGLRRERSLGDLVPLKDDVGGARRSGAEDQKNPHGCGASKASD